MPIHPDVAALLAGGLPDDLVLVGGQAALYFAEKYRGAEPALAELQGMTSVDSDFLGRCDHFPLLRQRLGAEPQIAPRKGGMLALSLARFDTGATPRHTVEVLGHVRGVREQEVLRTAVREEGAGADAHFRIINPVLLLESKAANLLELDQRGRNDLGHLWIAAFATRAYLGELNRAPGNGRALVTLANRVLDLAESHRGIELLGGFRLDLTQCLPRLDSNDPSVANFLEKGLPERLARIQRRAQPEGLAIGLPLDKGLPDPKTFCSPTREEPDRPRPGH